jgi:hypothetical protein
VICDNALLIAYATSQGKVSAKIIDEVARDLQLIERSPVKALEDRKPAFRPSGYDDDKRWPSGVTEFPALSNRSSIRRRDKRGWAGVTIAVGLAVVVLAGTILYTQQSGSLAALGVNIDDLVGTRWKNGPSTKNPPSSNPTGSRIPDERSFATEEPSGQIPLLQVPELSAANLNQKPPGEKTAIAENPPAPAPEANNLKTESEVTHAEPKEVPTKSRHQSQKLFSNDTEVTNEKLEFEIYKAIYNRAIRGVEVSVIDGTVYLTGRVATERQKIAAAQAARRVPGVKEVRDQVIVGTPTLRDSAG